MNIDILEKDIERYLRKEVIRAGGMCLKWVCPQHRGVPDRIVMIDGQIWFVEVKSPTGRLSKLQQEFADTLHKFKYNHMVINSKEMVDIFMNVVKYGKSDIT